MEKTSPSIKISRIAISEINDQALLIGCFKDNKDKLSNIDGSINEIVSSFIKDDYFKAEKGEIKNIYLNKNIKNIVLIGLGESEKFNLDILTTLFADTSKVLRANGNKSFSILLNSFNNGKFNEEDIVEKLVISILIGLYKFTEYKTKDKNDIKLISYINQITIISNNNKNYDREIEYALTVSTAINKTRDLINTPPNIANPDYIASYAKDLASKLNIKWTILDEEKIKEMKMECFIAVAKGSENKPKMVILEYCANNSKEKQKPIVIVGKGVTFDSGGLNLKSYPYILNMKDDKGGAVAAIHIIEACAKLKLSINLVVVIPLCENMPSGCAYRPDDVLTAYNGITVEIRNTDAEGRLILADALAYASKLDPQAIIDIATLTGASLIALGYVGTPFLSTDEKLSKKINDASKKSLEKVWEFPLWEEYEESIKSDVADLKHISEDGDAGVIMGATFLKNFVNNVPWAHLDIGTTVWSKTDKGILTKGATGVSVRLIIEMLKEWGQ